MRPPALPAFRSRTGNAIRRCRNVDLGPACPSSIRQARDGTTRGATMKYLLLVCWGCRELDAESERPRSNRYPGGGELPPGWRRAGAGHLGHRRPAGSAAAGALGPRPRWEADRHRRSLRRDEGGAGRVRLMSAAAWRKLSRSLPDTRSPRLGRSRSRSGGTSTAEWGAAPGQLPTETISRRSDGVARPSPSLGLAGRGLDDARGRDLLEAGPRKRTLATDDRQVEERFGHVEADWDGSTVCELQPE